MSPAAISGFSPSGALSAGLETGGQMGLALGLSSLVGAPYATRRIRSLAAVIGGGIPAVMRIGCSFAMARSEQERRAALVDSALTTLEVAAGLLCSLAPSRFWMQAAYTLTSAGFAFYRSDSWQVAAVAGVETGLIGALFHFLPHLPTKRRFHAWGGSPRGWLQVNESFSKNELSHDGFDRIRRHVSVPTLSWYLGEERRFLRRMSRNVRDAQSLIRTLERFGHEGKRPPSRFAIEAGRIDGLFSRLRQEWKEAFYCFEAYQGPQRRSSHRVIFEALEHEMGNELSPLAMTMQRIVRQHKKGGELLTHFQEAPKRSAHNLGLLLDFVLSPHRQGGPVSWIPQRLLPEGASVVLGQSGFPSFSRGEGLVTGIIASDLTRNALRVASSRGTRNPLVTIRLTESRLEVLDNAGGFSRRAKRQAGEGGTSGKGLKLARELAHSQHWNLNRHSLPGGTKFILTFNGKAA